MAKGRAKLARMREKRSELGETGEFGEIYTQFYHNPKKAIAFLRKKKSGECKAAFYREGVGDIDLVWGKVTDSVKHKGFGLSHIIDKHEASIKELGFSIEDFISIIIQYADFKSSDSGEEILFESNYFRIVVEKTYKGRSKHWILTAFDIRKKPL